MTLLSAPMISAAKSRLLFCNSRIFSSTVSRAISRYAKTGCCCPMRCARSVAEMKEIAERPTLAELRERLHKRKPVSAQIDSAHLVREEREAR